MRSDVCACMCVGGKYVHAYAVRAHVCVCARAREWMMRMFLANLPIQADINTIDCNWSVMCGI